MCSPKFDFSPQYFQVGSEAAEDIFHVEQQCFAKPWSQNSLETFLENFQSYCLVAKVQNKIVAYGGLLWVLDEGEITNIAVLPDFQSQGIGQELVKGLLSFSRRQELSYLHLEVAENNLKALRLYRRLGFQQVGRRKGYYEDGQVDALLFTYLI